jgi:transmembrane sensor
MDDASYWNLLAKYLSGQASDREIEQLEAWTHADPVRQKQVDEAFDAWNATEGRPLDLDVSGAWGALSTRIDRDEETATPPPRSGTGPSGRTERAPRARGRATSQRMLRLAGAMVMLVAAVGLAVWWSGPDPKVITTERGERSSFELIDGTHVDLNAQSKLTLSPDFGQGTRDVRLEGEAYFDVNHGGEQPFRVHTAEGGLRVLGTAFNVHAYTDEKEAQVTVSEGKVMLGARSSSGGAPADTVVLEPRQLGVMVDRHVRELRKGIDLEPHTAWREGRLVFEDAAFPEVVRRLERWYNLQVEMQTPVAPIDRLNAVFEDEAVGEVMSDIAIALGLKYQMQGARIVFWRREAGATSKKPPEDAPRTQNSTLLIN